MGFLYFIVSFFRQKLFKLRKTFSKLPIFNRMAKGKSAGAGKRVKKVLKANASSVSQGSIRRLARRGGVKRIAGPVYGEVRDVLRRFVDGVVRDATAYTEHAKHKTVSVQDIIAALRKRGRAIYGF